jgi:NAD(P)-dependent dehydrogenase (short-subunit alcohol dehydrogenase family)
MIPLGEKRFLHEDQERFAALSSDRNPMHMDPVAARRLLTGRQVVHGVHVFLSAMELWAAARGVSVASVGCTFANPVSVGDLVRFSEVEADPGTVALEASVDGLACARITLRFAPDEAGGPAAGSATVIGMDALAQPVEAAPETHVGKTYRLTVPVDAAARAFPAASSVLGAEAVAAAASLSYCVGMVCPGLHSIFSSFELSTRRGPGAAALDLTVRRFDPRVSLFDIVFDGAARGGIKAFQRPAPLAQPSMAEIAGHVDAQTFAGSVSLVIGASRGLGELTAKLLASGGARTVITYASGREDAERIAAEIRGSGRGSCVARRFDVIGETADALADILGEVTSVYFFATPRIYRKKIGVFDAALFDEFAAFYIGRFHALCLALEAATGGRKVRIYFPSTVFVTERPKGMTEYAMTKAAAEVLIDDLNRTLRNVEIVCTRLPRLETDQTNSVVRVKTASNLDALLPLVRSVELPPAG